MITPIKQKKKKLMVVKKVKEVETTLAKRKKNITQTNVSVYFFPFFSFFGVS